MKISVMGMFKRLSALLSLFAYPGLMSNPARAITTNVVFSNYSFNPSAITIHVGDTVMWSNGGGTHTVTGDNASDPFCGSGPVPQFCSVTFTNAGTFPYHCEFHVDFQMKGTVTVLDAETNSSPSLAPGVFVVHNLVADQPGVAERVDTNLLNPWGIATSTTSPFWVSDNHAGVSTLYNSTGGVMSLVVTVPGPTGSSSAGTPTGVIFNGSTNFAITGGPARFIFAGEDGVISAWNNSNGVAAVVMADNSASGAIYKGLASASTGGSNFLYAANFHAGTIDVFDGNFAAVNLPGAFVDATIPAGFAPFNIQNLGGNLYVTYAKQDEDKEDDVAGPGNGFINVFDPSGNLITNLVSGGALNSPWGLAWAPDSFGEIGGSLLVGNFGDGHINAYNPTNGAFLGALQDGKGNALEIEGLWGLIPGNGGNGGNTNTVYFTAGPGDESHGVFGGISTLAPTALVVHNLVADQPGVAERVDTNLLNPWGIATSTTSPFWVSDNHAGVSTLYNSTGGVMSLVVTVPGPTGSSSAGTPTGVIFNGSTNFAITGGPARFIFAGEDGVISAWNNSNGVAAVVMADNSASGAIYKGLASASTGGSNFLYAANFHAGTIDVFDGNFAAVNLPGAFVDATIPAGFAPFNIQNLGGNLYVTYAKQDEDKEDDVAGPGNGFINVFDPSGNLITNLVSGGALNSPWGLAWAPDSFGEIGGSLLVGNFGDGHINAYNPTNGAFLGALQDGKGNALEIEGLWGLIPGNGGNGGDTNNVYFTAGPQDESHGLFGSIGGPAPAVAGAIQFNSISNGTNGLTLSWSGGTAPYLIQEKFSISDTNWMDLVTVSNTTASVPLVGPNGFFRVSDHATNQVSLITVALDGPSEIPITTSPATGAGVLSIEGNILTYYIVFSGLTGPATDAHIHGPAGPTESASPIKGLNFPPAAAGVMSGTIDLSTLSGGNVQAIKTGNAYANIHTDEHGGGEIRGQLVPR